MKCIHLKGQSWVSSWSTLMSQKCMEISLFQQSTRMYRDDLKGLVDYTPFNLWTLLRSQPIVCCVTNYCHTNCDCPSLKTRITLYISDNLFMCLFNKRDIDSLFAHF